MQRHVEDSIATLRWNIAVAIAGTLHRCPCGCRHSNNLQYA